MISRLALLIAFLCVHCARGWTSWAAFQYFEVVTLWFLIALLIFFLMHLFRLQGRMPCINWPLTVSSRTPLPPCSSVIDSLHTSDGYHDMFYTRLTITMT
eukprot:superscaffoldBa00010685_g24836